MTGAAPSGERSTAAGLPVRLPVRGRAVLVRGGGPDALAATVRLLEAGAVVAVVDSAPAPAIEDLAARGAVTLVAGTLDLAQVASAWLVVAASGDPVTDRETALFAEQTGKFCLSERLSVPEFAVPELSVGAETEPESGPEASPVSEPSGRADDSADGSADDSADGAPTPTAPATTVANRAAGKVILVGGGPGDPGLLTVAGRDALRTADVVLVDRLAPLSALSEIRPGAVVVDVSKIPRGRFTPQDEINRLLVEHGSAGRTVVRLKGGDSFVFGRGGEEWQACLAAGLPVTVIPGVSSALAAPALAGIPVTHRTMTQGFTVVSGHLVPGDPASSLDWSALARSGTTLILMMAVKNLSAITAALLAEGMSPDTPAAGVADAGSPRQRTVRARLADIAAVSAEAGITAPAVTVIGEVAGFDPTNAG